MQKKLKISKSIKDRKAKNTRRNTRSELIKCTEEA